MKVTVELSAEQMDEIVLRSLHDTLDLYTSDVSSHPEDLEHYEKLIPALELVIKDYEPPQGR